MAVSHLLSIFLMAFSLVSLNVRGLRSPMRLHSVTHSTKRDILCVQETWWERPHLQSALDLNVGEVFCALGSARSRGVAVFIRPGLFGSSTLVHSDPGGACTVIDFHEPFYFRLINKYAMNVKSDRQELFLTLVSFINMDTVIIGDFNTPLSKL